MEAGKMNLRDLLSLLTVIELKKKGFDHIDLPAKLVYYFLPSNNSNINQCKLKKNVNLCLFLVYYRFGIRILYPKAKCLKAYLATTNSFLASFLLIYALTSL